MNLQFMENVCDFPQKTQKMRLSAIGGTVAIIYCFRSQYLCFFMSARFEKIFRTELCGMNKMFIIVGDPKIFTPIWCSLQCQVCLF